jgi:hypothetical protein
MPLNVEKNGLMIAEDYLKLYVVTMDVNFNSTGRAVDCKLQKGFFLIDHPGSPSCAYNPTTAVVKLGVRNTVWNSRRAFRPPSIPEDNTSNNANS